MSSEWITDRQPLPVDALDNGAVRVRLSPESDVCVYMHRANVGLGTPWRHCVAWTFPEIRIGQVWRCKDGKVRVVKRGDSNSCWLIGEYYYTSDGAALGTLTSVRLAELISQPEEEPEPQQETRPEPQLRRRFAGLNGYVSNGEEILLAIDTDGGAWLLAPSKKWTRIVDLPN